MTPLSDIVGQLESTIDPESVLRCLVLEDGGDWPAELQSDRRYLVEIQFRGVTGFGFDTGAATRDWLNNARHDMEDHSWFALRRRANDHECAGEGVPSIL